MLNEDRVILIIYSHPLSPRLNRWDPQTQARINITSTYQLMRITPYRVNLTRNQSPFCLFFFYIQWWSVSFWAAMCPECRLWCYGEPAWIFPQFRINTDVSQNSYHQYIKKSPAGAQDGKKRPFVHPGVDGRFKGQIYRILWIFLHFDRFSCPFYAVKWHKTMKLVDTCSPGACYE